MKTEFKVLKPFRHNNEIVKKGDIIELLGFQARQLGDSVAPYLKPKTKETKLKEDK